MVCEANLADALCKFLSLAPVRPADLPLERVLSEVIDAEFVRRNRVLPLSLKNGLISLGVTDPLDSEPVRAIAYLTGLTVGIAVYVRGFREAFDTLYVARAQAPAGSDRGGEASETDVRRRALARHRERGSRHPFG